MTDVRHKEEKLLSRKILVHGINRFLPFLRPVINGVRFFTFRTRCPDYPKSAASYSDGSWVARKVTKDQQAIEAYLSKQDLRGKKILHVGVGSSHLAKEFSGITIEGVTIIPEEKIYADELKYINFKVNIINKNDPEELGQLAGPYAFIVDNDLASYACCKTHFEEMLKKYLTLLAPGGEILAGEVSRGYFDSGFPLPDFYLKKLAQTLSFACISNQGLLRIHRHPGESRGPGLGPGFRRGDKVKPAR